MLCIQTEIETELVKGLLLCFNSTSVAICETQRTKQLVPPFLSNVLTALAVYTDNTDPQLTMLMEEIVNTYATVPAIISNENHRADR